MQLIAASFRRPKHAWLVYARQLRHRSSDARHAGAWIFGRALLAGIDVVIGEAQRCLAKRLSCNRCAVAS